MTIIAVRVVVVPMVAVGVAVMVVMAIGLAGTTGV